MENSGAATVIALIVVLSFAVDRAVAGLLFVLSLSSKWRRGFPEPALVSEDEARARAERRKKLIYFALAAVLSVAILAGFPNVRIIRALGLSKAANESAANPAATASPTPNPAPTPTPSASPTTGAGTSPGPSWPLESILDFIVTGLILMAGAERIAVLIKPPGAAGGEGSREQPIHITGKLTVEDAGGSKEAKL